MALREGYCGRRFVESLAYSPFRRAQVCVYMKEVFSASECFILVKLDMRVIQDLHLDINVHTVRQSILKGGFGETRPRVLKDLKPQHVNVSAGGNKVRSIGWLIGSRPRVTRLSSGFRHLKGMRLKPTGCCTSPSQVGPLCAAHLHSAVVLFREGCCSRIPLAIMVRELIGPYRD